MLELSKFTTGNPNHPPLIFLHGFLGNKEDWEALIPFFRHRFYCIALDLPGHGESPYSEEVIMTVKQALEAYDSPMCIGYSMGGRIALQLQENFSSLIILSAHPGLPTHKEKEARRLIDEQWCQKLLYLPIDHFFTEWYAQPIFHPLPRNAVLLQKMVKRRMKQNPQFLVGVLRQMSLANQPHITEFKRPTLFLYGEEDLNYRQLYSNLSKTVSVGCVKDSGHAILLENVADCARQIINWIEVLYANSGK